MLLKFLYRMEWKNNVYKKKLYFKIENEVFVIYNKM